MGRRAAKALHLALFLVGVVLYVLFVLPRWWVLTGDIPTAVATAGRIAAGIPIALGALPALSILKLALGRKAKTPELALRLRAWSAVLHVVAGVLIAVTAIVEIWLRLAVGGPYLFAVYGAAGAIAILAVLALYLSFVAEKPPAPPKPPKPPKPAKPAKAKKVKAKKVKAAKEPRGAKRATVAAADTNAGDEVPADESQATESVEDEPASAESDKPAPEEADAETGDVVDAVAVNESTDDAAVDPKPAASGLRNRRGGKNRHRLPR